MYEVEFVDECDEILYYLENTSASRKFLRAPIVKKLNEILRLGHIAERGDEDYAGYGSSVNCLEHACFNLTNEQIESLGLDEFKYKFVNPFCAFGCETIDEAKEEIFEFLKETGLEISEDTPSKILKANQHRVAMYFSEAVENGMGIKTFHFLIQEKDGSWSGKTGDSSAQVEHFSKLEERLPFDISNKYILDSVFVITNPYAPEEKQK